MDDVTQSVIGCPGKKINILFSLKLEEFRLQKNTSLSKATWENTAVVCKSCVDGTYSSKNPKQNE